MAATQMAKQMIDFQKSILNNSYNALTVIQNQTETMINSYAEQLPWMTDEVKTQLTQNFEQARKAGEEFKKAIDDGYARFEAMLD